MICSRIVLLTMHSSCTAPARSLDTVTCRGNRRHQEAEQKHEDDDRLKKGFRVVGIKFSWQGHILGLLLSFSSTFAIRAGLPKCRLHALRRYEATEGVAGDA